MHSSRRNHVTRVLGRNDGRTALVTILTADCPSRLQQNKIPSRFLLRVADSSVGKFRFTFVFVNIDDSVA